MNCELKLHYLSSINPWFDCWGTVKFWVLWNCCLYSNRDGECLAHEPCKAYEIICFDPAKAIAGGTHSINLCQANFKLIILCGLQIML